MCGLYRLSILLHRGLEDRRTSGNPPYNGTKEEEIETLKLVFPYKDDAYNINGFDRFKPGGKLNETDYHTYRKSLYGDMEIMDCYVAIADIMKHMISSQHIYVSTRSQYMYSPALLEYLYQVTPPPATTVEEYDFRTRGKVTKDTKPMSERWNTVEKERKDRDRRTNARAQIKQRLTRKDPPKNYSTFDSDDEEENEEEQ
jgi:hypothetical protein